MSTNIIKADFNYSNWPARFMGFWIFRLLCLDERISKFSLLPISLSLEHCPLVLRMKTLLSGQKLLFLGSTDGLIRIYDVTNMCNKIEDCGELASSEPELLLILRHHQSGVNGLMVCSTDDTNLTVCSGGDDNSLVISELSLPSLSVTETRRFSTSHSAQITGKLRWLHHHSPQHNILMVTTGSMHLYTNSTYAVDWYMQSYVKIYQGSAPRVFNHGAMIQINQKLLGELLKTIVEQYYSRSR